MENRLDEMESRESLADVIIRNGLAGQRQILEEQLRKGVPLFYENEAGQLIKKNPDGSTEYTTYEKSLSE